METKYTQNMLFFLNRKLGLDRNGTLIISICMQNDEEMVGTENSSIS